MVKPAAVAVLLTVPALALAACSPQQHGTSEPGTTPPVWTGSSAPNTTPTQGADGSGEQLRATLNSPDGAPVATATIDFVAGYATITVETIGDGILKPGFHGLHIHSVGKCEPDSEGPNGGPRANFASAGGHLQVDGRTEHPASGDLTSLQVRQDGSAKLITTTDAFDAKQLLDGQGTAIIIHEKPDNFANIPADRYQQTNGQPPPDQETLATGDAGQRIACGRIEG